MDWVSVGQEMLQRVLPRLCWDLQTQALSTSNTSCNEVAGSRATVLPYTLLPAVDASRSPHWLWGCSGTQIPAASVTSRPLSLSPSARRP